MTAERTSTAGGAHGRDTRAVPTVSSAAGAVCSVDPRASAAGAAALDAGGSAVDAAVAASAVLAVTSPHLCGMGGDLFALVHRPGDHEPAALDASGRAGSGADPARLLAEGRRRMPFHRDVRSAPVPGCVDGWLALHDRFGRLRIEEVLEPAIDFAEEGFEPSALLRSALPLLDGVAGAGDLRDGLQADDIHRPGVARALRAITATGRDGFYGGEFGQGLRSLGAGEYSAADLARPLADWVRPLRTRAWGHEVWTVPPASQGYLTLLGCAIAEGLDLGDPGDARWAHLLVESARAAGHDRPDVLHEGADVAPLLAEGEVRRRRGLVDPARRNDALPAPAAAGGTMHLCAGDSDGTAISLIQSNASGFGALVFEPATGIGLHNRGIGFNLRPGHPACYGPGRRPPHTLAPALVTSPDGDLRAVLGTMGGDSQPQILLQLLCRWLQHGFDPGSAVDAPRWVLAGRSGFDTWTTSGGAVVRLEAGVPSGWAPGLRRRGHEVEEAPPAAAHAFGHAHLLERAAGSWLGATDPRAGGTVAASTC